MDSKLTFVDHTKHIISKINSAFYQLYHLAKYTNEDLRKLLVTVLILPHINYGTVVVNGLRTVQGIKLLRLVNRGVRFIKELRRDTSISTPRQQLGWLNTVNNRKYFLA